MKNNDFDYLIKRFETNFKRQNQSNTFFDDNNQFKLLTFVSYEYYSRIKTIANVFKNDLNQSIFREIVLNAIVKSK